ncbi:MAG: hypothetical protein HOE48_10985 [Candidatus Latescibacteria bacterium]|nr:hypothetical protein [Candidatus Latescibacterota bacterium]
MKLYTWMFLGLLIPQVAWGVTANITKIENKKVVIDIGASRGLVAGMKADVLTNAGQVVHPITGENYGPRRVKIGEIEITSVSPEAAAGRILVVYGPIRVGDIVEGLIALPSEDERMQMDIDEARSEIKALARSLADEIKGNQKGIEDLRRSLSRVGSSEQRLRQVMNAVQNMRERMVVFENRIATMEQQQQVMISQDSLEVPVRDQVLEMEQRVKQLETQQAELESMSMKMAAITPDSIMEEQPTATDEGELDALFPEDEEAEAETPWYFSWWFLGIVFAIIGLAAVAAILILKKKQGQSDGEGSADLDGDISIDEDGFEEVGGDDLIEDLPDDLPELETADDEI